MCKNNYLLIRINLHNGFGTQESLVINLIIVFAWTALTDLLEETKNAKKNWGLNRYDLNKNREFWF